MGIVKRLNPRAGYNPKTAATAQNSPHNIQSGAGTRAAESQISAPAEPWRNPQGAANFQRNRTNDAATQGVGDGQSRNAANIAGGQPMSDGQVLRGAGYERRPRLSGYAVHNPEQQSARFGTVAARGRQASEVTRGRNTTGRKPLYKRESNADIFGEGAKLYRERHGSL